MGVGVGILAYVEGYDMGGLCGVSRKGERFITDGMLEA